MARLPVAQYATENPSQVTLLDSGKLRFNETGMEFPPNATRENILAYVNGRSMRRALAAKANAAYDFEAHRPYIIPHKVRDEKHFLYCTLTHKTLPRMAHKVSTHVDSLRYQQRLLDLLERAKKEQDRVSVKKKKSAGVKLEDAEDVAMDIDDEHVLNSSLSEMEEDDVERSSAAEAPDDDETMDAQLECATSADASGDDVLMTADIAGDADASTDDQDVVTSETGREVRLRRPGRAKAAKAKAEMTPEEGQAYKQSLKEYRVAVRKWKKLETRKRLSKDAKVKKGVRSPEEDAVNDTACEEGEKSTTKKQKPRKTETRMKNKWIGRNGPVGEASSAEEKAAADKPVSPDGVKQEKQTAIAERAHQPNATTENGAAGGTPKATVRVRTKTRKRKNTGSPKKTQDLNSDDMEVQNETSSRENTAPEAEAASSDKKQKRSKRKVATSPYTDLIKDADNEDDGTLEILKRKRQNILPKKSIRPKQKRKTKS